jgi:predicted RNA-binding Zn-ribbon protein involved in translation (DUF1610 family)
VKPSLAPPPDHSSDDPPIEKEDPSFPGRYLVPLIGISSVGLAFIFGFGATAILNHRWWGIPLCCALIAATIAGLVVMHKIVIGRYQCPNCGASLRHCDERQYREYFFHCKRCNIRWKTHVDRFV